MKLLDLYLNEQDSSIPLDDTKDTIKEAGDQIEAITTDLKKAIEGVVRSLGRLPVMSTRTEARTNLEMLMGNLTKLIKTFDEGGTNYEAMLSAILAGGKQSGV